MVLYILSCPQNVGINKNILHWDPQPLWELCPAGFTQTSWVQKLALRAALAPEKHSSSCLAFLVTYLCYQDQAHIHLQGAGVTQHTGLGQ